MSVPKCLQNKALLIVLPLLATSIGSSSAALYNQIDNTTQYNYEQDRRINMIEQQVAENNVPEVKTFITSTIRDLRAEIDKDTDKIQVSVDKNSDKIDIQNQNIVDLKIIVCTIPGAKC